MFVAAGGLWLARYWAVLGFEALLGIIVVFFSLFLLRASNVLAVVVCVPIIGAGRLAVLEAHPRDGQAPGSPARSLDSGALWLTPSTTASSSARGPAAMSPPSAPPSSA